MRKLSFLLAVLLLASTISSAKKKQIMPLVITNATYAFVTTYEGTPLNPGLTPEDRQAVLDVQDALRKWGRYKLVYNPGEADLILVVRTGRIAEAKVGLERGTLGRGGSPGASSQSISAENGDPEDTLDVFVSSQDLKTAPPLWRARALNGLQAPELRLMKDFESKVDASAGKKP